MTYINDHYLKLTAGYLFPEIGRRVQAFCEANPSANVIRLGIGDVTEPLAPAVIQAMHTAVDELAERSSFHGYGPEQGYDFLRVAIAEHDYRARGAEVDADEIFVSDCSKCDSGNILDIFGENNVIAVLDPVYPVYVDTNVMAGHTGPADASGRYGGLVYLPVTADNDFVPELPRQRVDRFTCAIRITRLAWLPPRMLKRWVEYAQQNGSVILYDAAYEAYITDPAIPHSTKLTEPGKSRSNSAVSANGRHRRALCLLIPKDLKGKARDGREVAIHPLWNRRHYFNGTVSRAARRAGLPPEGKQQVRETIEFYLANARLVREALTSGDTGLAG